LQRACHVSERSTPPIDAVARQHPARYRRSAMRRFAFILLLAPFVLGDVAVGPCGSCGRSRQTCADVTCGAGQQCRQYGPHAVCVATDAGPAHP
jgi:hypothetical protein